MAFSMTGDSSTSDDLDDLPVYSQADAVSQGGSTGTQPGPSASAPSGSNSRPSPAAASQATPSPSTFNSRLEPLGTGTPFTPESLAALNPEVAKKLAAQSREMGYEVADFGFLSSEAAARIDTGSESGRDVVPPMPPPTFAEGETRPTYEIDGQGNIVSHDLALNSSPAALLRFLRLHCSSPPSLHLHLRGSHTERRSETHIETHNGRRRARTETRDVEVEDFQFSIDASKLVEEGLGSARGVGGVRGVLYEVGGWEQTYRGGSVRLRERAPSEGKEGAIRLPEEEDEESRVGALPLSRRLSLRHSKWIHTGWREGRKLDQEKRERDARGYPSFVHPDSLRDMDEDSRPEDEQAVHPATLFHSQFVDLVECHASIAHSLTRTNAGPFPSSFDALLEEREKRDDAVRRIVEQYCASDKKLKELVVAKELYGWNWKLLEAGIRATINATHYNGTVQVQFKSTPETIIIRPENMVSKIFSAPIWVKMILWVLLVYPVLLMVEVFIGDRYQNLRVAFPLTRWRRLPLPAPSQSAGSSSSSSSSSRPSAAEALELAKPLAARKPKITQLPVDKSFLYLVGVQEGEWLKAWEGSIVNAVRSGKRGVVLSEQEREELRPDARMSLRGYSE